ncbi:beta-ketoacyl synthase [Antarcticibacterium flavum]|uniref:Beta-ketoacyl synthase n=1 Tax=Antarcticibacterium flavum TaxID=2058175 RepID=A0A5B7WYF4_9FLAO|nr:MULTISPECIES: beta-ketoacyl synthase N-terminal-like domain-containing protein [Antarcticibacterium]MCM4158823.1 beta-ketoacyl synthase [Antarcticibacterium sp. W02-3]QCY68087.1 beta-ketoacyl synthase [Antarcticibacterium flavum]
MTKRIFLLGDAIISPLGFDTEENLQALREERSGLLNHPNSFFPKEGLVAGIIDNDKLTAALSNFGDPSGYTRLEKMMILAVQKVLQQHPDIDLTTTALIISTTKGNIDLLGDHKFPEVRVLPGEMGRVIANFFGFSLEPVIVSNACISGGLAIAIAKRFMEAGKMERAIVVGGDLVSDFVVSGFQSFQAISPQACRPFSKNRNGISLGEAAAAVLVSKKPGTQGKYIELIGEATANDANHISGPSRTGEGLFKSIAAALKEAGIMAGEIDYISAHGTATLFNDEMEAIAFSRSGLRNTPINSFKGWYGHTLGASALVETILTKHSLLNNELFCSLNFEETGTSEKINVITKRENRKLGYALKTASGFGGCNLTLVLKKGYNG